MTDNNSVHVIFGTGPVGLSVMRALHDMGHRIRMINRSGRADVPDAVEVIGGDAMDVDFARTVCEDARVVYQCLNPPYNKWPELFPPLQKNVLEGASAVGAKLIAMENVYMYGSTDGHPLTEETPHNAQTKKGKVRAQMARELITAHEQGKVRVAMGRASDFFGPGVLNSAMGDRVFERAVQGKAAQVIGNPDLPHTYTYMPDIGKALVRLGESDEALGQAWHIPSPQTLTTRQFIEKIYLALGHKQAKVQAAPKLLLRAFGLFDPAVREIIEMLYEFEEAFIVNSRKFEQSFGMVATPLDDAINATVEWYQQR